MVGVDVSCAGFMVAGSMRSLGFLPMAHAKGDLSLRVTCVFLTVAALRINWEGMICDSILVQILGGCVHKCREELFFYTVGDPFQLDLSKEYVVQQEIF